MTDILSKWETGRLIFSLSGAAVLREITSEDGLWKGNRIETLTPNKYSLSELSEHESWVYQNQQRAAEGASLLPKPKPEKPWKSLEDFSAENREEIAK